MRLLCLTARLPYPPDRGDRLRAFHMIEHLAREHEITLVSFIADKAEREHLAQLRPYCRELHVVARGPRWSAVTAGANLWRRQPLQALYYRSRAMHQLVERLLDRQRFDATYVHLFRMAPYVLAHPELYRIIDLTDVVSEEVNRSLPYRRPFWRLVYTLERPRIERYERYIVNQLEETWLIAEADRQLLAAVCPQANIQVIPNGVDVATFRPTGQSPEPDSLIFVGHMGVYHNVDAAIHLARDVLPLVQKQLPGCRLTLAGANPAPEVRRLAENPAVTVTGFVPDLNRCLNQAAVFVAPLRFAAGVQNKVLEAMAAGRPVVTTTLVNQGLGAQPGQELLVADGAEQTARQIVALLRDEQLRARLGAAGRAFVQKTYSWKHAVRRMREVEKSLLEAGRLQEVGPDTP
ncbi:MAG: TIGR03087 family PEP-CTERM/XrtA system glycosyltransferase [Chloroflexi bacterium]|nr:TIGR03087 family PEP-CTERM/XrtA system glycosyltransferase [Chloroflexota bacterium]MCI0725285.1 TIGR03087 family PEP-CTERM/XrtA system glycosyltransferase [Chloroflexota bacterium]